MNCVKHVVTKNIELSNSFIQLKSDMQNIKDQITKKLEESKKEIVQSKTSIYHITPMNEELIAPDFTKHRLESAIVKEGNR